MQFTVRKRRQPPAVIIISLIDVLIVVLIFLMVTTTTKQQPAVKLVLPESKQGKPGATENPALILTIPKQGPLLLEGMPLTLEDLQRRLTDAVRKNPETSLSISADKDAPFGQIIKVMDAAKAANLKVVSAFTKSPAAGAK